MPPPNAPHLAETGIDIQYNDALLLPPQRGELHLQEFVDVPIGVLKVFPASSLISSSPL